MTLALTPEAPPVMEWPPEEEIQGTNLPTAPIVPHSREAEEATIGAVLIDPGSYPELAAILKPADFYIRRHGWIWQAFEHLTERGDPLDFLTISGELTRMGQLDEIGGPSYLTALLNQVPSSLNAATYARKVKDAASKRGMLAAANEIATLAYNPRVTSEEATARALEAIQENAGSTQEITLRTDADALEPHPPRQWVVENLIMEKTLTILYADAGSKKTYICLALAESVCHGLPWLAYTTHPAPVLYLDEENGEDEIDDRLKQVLGGLICLPSQRFYYVSYAGLLLDNPADCLRIKALIERTGAKLVIFDSLQDFMVGDENSKQDTQPIFTALKKLTNQTGAAILAQHHAGKSGDYRGSTTIKGNVDLMLEVTSTDDSDLITFKSKKNRKGTPVKFTAEAIWWDDTFTLKPSTQQAAHSLSKAEDYVIRFFTDHPDSTVKDCEDSADVCSAGTAHNTLYNLAARGILRRINPGERTARYSLVSVTCNGSVTDE